MVQAVSQKQSKPYDIRERTFRFAVEIVRFCRLLTDKPGVWRTLGQQLLRSGTSVGANVEEGQSAQSRADFINKYNIALKEARETLYWLRLICDANVGDYPQLPALKIEAAEIANILGAIIVKAKEREKG